MNVERMWIYFDEENKRYNTIRSKEKNNMRMCEEQIETIRKSCNKGWNFRKISFTYTVNSKRILGEKETSSVLK
jgi:hypothetical protein